MQVKVQNPSLSASIREAVHNHLVLRDTIIDQCEDLQGTLSLIGSCLMAADPALFWLLADSRYGGVQKLRS